MSFEDHPGSPPRKPASSTWPPFVPPVARPEPAATETDDPAEIKGKAGKKKKKKKGRLGSERGIETMFRNSYRTHIDMSGLADAKANIMISINGLIMSILIAGISRGIDTNPWLLAPTSVLLVTCLTSLVFAVLAARPRVTTQALTLEDVRASRANILFFGNFVNMPQDDFITGMTELMQNPDELYLNMMRDLYGLGRVLQRKFRLLRIAYNVFMAGLAVGVIAFIVVLVSVATSSQVAVGS